MSKLKAECLTGANLTSWQLLEKFIADWADERNLIQGTKQQATMQAAYMVTELKELIDVMQFYKKGTEIRNASIKDAIGDTFVTIVNTFANLEPKRLLVEQLKDVSEVDPYFQIEDALREIVNEDQHESLAGTIFTYSARIFQHILKQEEGYLDEYINDVSELLALLSYIAESIGETLYSCAVFAYEEISSRTGKTVNGVFIKD